MKVEILLEELAQNNVKLSVKEDKLLCQLPDGGIDSSLLDLLKQHKEAIKEVIQTSKKSRLARPSITKRRSDSSARPLSYMQQRLWILDQIEGSAHYNISNALLLEGELDVDIFQKAFNTIVERHEIIRTVYEVGENGEPCQVIQPVQPLPVLKMDLTDFGEEEQNKRIKLLQTEDSKMTFDLKRDIMLRVTLIQVKDNSFVLLVTMHHIATDGWSFGILIKEFCTLYRAYSKAEKNPLPDLNVQYADYAHWQQEWLQGETLAQLKGYWLDRLQGLPSVHSLPLDHERPAVRTFRGHTIYSHIDKGTLIALQDLCNKEGATLFAGLYTAFCVLLSRYSNEKDIGVGTPVANRQQQEIENLIGFFVNMLVLRSQLPENISYVELLRHTRSMLFDAYAHQQMPYDMLVSALQPERNAGYSPLFQIMFVLQNNERSAVELPGVSLKQMEQSKPFSMYDLSLLINENERGLSLSWEYNTDIFSLATIQRVSGHFERLLASLLQSPDTDVYKAALMADEETDQVLAGFNQTAMPYPQFKSVIDLFEAQVLNTPDATAVVFENNVYTYHELNEATNRLARYLGEIKKSAGANRIGVMLNRSAESVVAMVAIMRAGACYVPIDYKLPSATIDHILRDTEIQLVLTRKGIFDTNSRADIDLVFIDELDLSNYDAANLYVPLHKEGESYVIYTSGSTGTPKGVVQTHLMLSNLVQWNAARSGIEPGLKLLQYSSFYFDVSLQDCWFTLCNGGELHVTSDDIRTDLTSLLKYIITKKVAVLVFPFSAMRVFFLSNGLPDFEGHSIRHIVASGEQLIVNAPLKEFLEHNPEVKLHNHYGPSETHVVTSFTIQAAAGPVINYLPIGKPVDNTAIYILDKYLQPVPVGVKGEIYIEGANLAIGYLNLPHLTAERFITSPFGTGKNLYKTGDIAYWLPDGNIVYANRNDNQLKIRGYRIEPREIEKALEELPQVKNAIVNVFAQGADKSLCAYLVMDAELDIQAIRTYLYSKVPDYMMPSYFVRIERIPITTNGKINKKALPDPLVYGSRIANEYVAPENETEATLVSIWEEVLNRKEIGTTENFFELGGDSIKAIGLLHRVQKQFSLQIKVIDFFTRPTVKLLAEEIDTVLLLRKQQTKKERRTLKI